jgi:hypothetical protein
VDPLTHDWEREWLEELALCAEIRLDIDPLQQERETWHL